MLRMISVEGFAASATPPALRIAPLGLSKSRPLCPACNLRKATDYEGEIVARYVELVRCQFSQAMRSAMLLVCCLSLLRISPGKCSVMLVAGPRCGGGPRSKLIPLVRSSVDLVVSTTIASRKWRGLYIDPPLSHGKWRSVGWRARSYSGSSAWYKTNGFALVCSSPCPNRPAGWIAATFSRPRHLVQALGSADCGIQVLRELTGAREIFAGRLMAARVPSD
jgi:hypothetical protein